MRFGRYPENITIKQHWGARAIFNKSTDYKIDIPYDRKSYEGNKEDAKDFINWVNKDFFKWLNKEANKKLYLNQNIVIKYHSVDGKYQGEASCQESYGYLYMGCWEI